MSVRFEESRTGKRRRHVGEVLLVGLYRLLFSVVHGRQWPAQAMVDRFVVLDT